jgi:hypothetical protein
MGLGKGVTGTTQTGGGTLWVWKWEGGGRCRGEEGHVTVERVRTENGLDRVLKIPDRIRPDPSDPWPRPAPTRPVLKPVGPVTR